MKAEHLLPIALFFLACGGGTSSSPPAETPPAPKEPTAADMPPPTPAAAAPAPTPRAPPEPPPAAPPPNVEFPPHASVEQAIKAIPQGAPRMNMSNDVLQKPLLDLQRYDKCKVPRSTKVTMTVAV